MKKDDTCYYMSITKEENSAFVVNQNQAQQNLTDASGKEGRSLYNFYATNSYATVSNFIFLKYSKPDYNNEKKNHIKTTIMFQNFNINNYYYFFQFSCKI